MVEFLIVSIIFYLLGRVSRTPLIEKVIEKAQKTITPKKTIQAGVIPFKTPEDFAAEKSGEKALEDHWITSGIAKLIGARK